MSERRVTWNAVANFAQVRREAERTSRSLKDLEDRQRALGTASEDSSEKISRANERAARSRDDDTRAAKNQTVAIQTLERSRARESQVSDRVAVSNQRVAQSRNTDSQAARSQADSSSTVASALDREGRSSGALGGFLSRLSEARRRESRASQDQTAAARSLAAAQAGEAKAADQVARANLNLEQSRLRLARAEQQSARASRDLISAQQKAASAAGDNTKELDALARAQDRVAQRDHDLAAARLQVDRATRTVTRSTSDYEHASSRAGEAARRMSNDTDRNSGVLRRLTRNLHEGRDAARGFGTALTLLKFTALAAGIAHLIPLITQLVAGLTAVVGAIGPVVNALAVLPQMAIGAATAFGAVAMGLSGIGGALKAYGQQQAATGKSAQKSTRDAARAAEDAARTVARAREAAAEAAEDSARRIQDAEEAQVESARESAERIADALKRQAEVVRRSEERIADAVARQAEVIENAAERVTDAKERQAEVWESGAERIARAEQQAASAAQSAARAVADASRRLADAQKAERDALDSLNDSREDAIKFLDDMNDRMRDAALSEESAVLGLEEARIRLLEVMNDPTASSLDKKRADLNYREAMARLDDAREARIEANAENAEAQAKGVEGSDIMVAAYGRVADAQNTVAEAQQGLAEAQANAAQSAAESARAVAEAREEAAESAAKAAEDVADAEKEAAKSVAEASRAVVEAKEEAARDLIDAADNVKDAEDDAARSAIDAQRNVDDARRAAARSARDSARSIEDALRSQADSAARAAEQIATAAAAPDKFAEAMAKLGPAGQSFVKFLISLKPMFDELKKEVQEGFLPGMERGLRTLTENLAPMVGVALVNMGKILGDGFSDFADVMGGTESKDILSRIFESNEIAAKNTTAAMGPLYLGIMRVADAFRPLAEWLSELVLQFANWLDVTTKVNTANGDLAESMEHAKESLQVVGNILKNFGTILYNVGKGGRDTGMGLLEMFNAWLEKWAEWTGSVEGQNSIKKYFEDARPGIEAAANLIGAIGRLFLDLGVNPQTAEILNKLAGPGMDAVERIVKALTENSIGTSLADGIISIAEGIATLLESGGGGVLSAFVESLSMMFDILSKIVQIPGVGEVLSGVAVAVGTMKAAKVVGAVTGITPLVGTARKAVKSARASTDPTLPPADPTGSAAASATTGTGFMSMMPWSKKKPPAPTPTRPPSGAASGPKSSTMPGFWGSMGTTPKDTKPARKPSARAAKAAAPVAKAGAAGKKFSVGKAGAAVSVAAGIGALINFAAPEAAAGKFGGVLSNLSSILFMIIPLLPMLAAAIGGLTLPITLVVAAIAGFVAGIVYLWKNNESFRNFIITAWNNIVEAVKGAWENHIWPALQKFADFFVTNVIPVLQTLWGVAKTVFEAIGTAIGWAWENLIKPAFSALWSFITDVLVPVFQVIWEVVKTVFEAIGTVIGWAWDNIIKPVFSALWSFITDVLVPIFQAVWKVVKTVFEAIGTIISFAWENVIKPVLSALWGFIKDTLVPIFMWFWENTKVLFGFIGALIAFTWNNVIKPALQAIWNFIKTTLVPIFLWFWEQSKVIFGFIGALIKAAWESVIKPVFQAIWNFIKDTLGPVFDWLWKKIIEPAWNGIKSAIDTVWNKGIKPVLQAFGDFFNNTLVPAFQKGVGAITTAWEKVQEAIKKPINWVIREVINRGIIDTFNKVSKVVGGPTMTHASEIGAKATTSVARGLVAAEGGLIYDLSGPTPRYGARRAYATGGRVRGQSLHKRQDNIDARLTAGEWVHPVDSAKYYGSRFMEMVRRRRFPRDIAMQFAEGGEAPALSGPSADGIGDGEGILGSLGDWISGKLDPSKVFNGLIDKVWHLVPPPGDHWIKDWVKAVPRKLVSHAISKIAGLIDIFKSSGGGAGTPSGGAGMGWAAMERWIESQGLGAYVTDRARPSGTKTASGAVSFHGLGRAIDIVGPNMAGIADYIVNSYGVQNITELIYTPRGSRNIYKGRYYTPSAVTLRNHKDHVHWAMNQGGPVGSPAPKLGARRYAEGGPVLSPRTPFSSQSFQGTRMRSLASAKGVVFNISGANASANNAAPVMPINAPHITTNIYNPVGEPSEVSINRRMQKIAELGMV